MFYNAWSACYRPEIDAMAEHPMPFLGYSNPVIFKTSDEANATVTSRDRRTLTVRFDPGRWYDIMLLGTAEASAEEGQRALARLDVKDLKLKLTFSPAATQPAGPQS